MKEKGKERFIIIKFKKKRNKEEDLHMKWDCSKNNNSQLHYIRIKMMSLRQSKRKGIKNYLRMFNIHF